DVHHSHALRRAEVTSYRLAPLRESVAWDLADRFERRSGLLVIADPGHRMSPCWYPASLPTAPGNASLCAHASDAGQHQRRHVIRALRLVQRAGPDHDTAAASELGMRRLIGVSVLAAVRPGDHALV